MNYIVYFLVLGICKLLAFLPLRILYIFSDISWPIVYYLFQYRKNVVFENLRNAFPDKPEKEITEIAKKFYRHFCDILFEMVKLFYISPSEIKKRMNYRHPELLEDEFRKNKHAFMVLGHYNNWEWGAGLNLSGLHQFTSIYKPLSNKAMDDILIRLRSQFGSEVIPMRQTARVLNQNIRLGKLTQMNFITDQSPMKDEIHYWTTFLNQETPVYLGIEKLARKYRQPVFYATIVKVKRGYYEVELKKLCDDCSMLKPYELTEMHTKLLEADIMKHPECWLWSHRRWKIKKEPTSHPINHG
jgi:Kdo2-lipid IVA lauroyltransferase/acyltransferase